MKLLLLYPPFCTPTTVPYSISYLKSFLKDNIKIKDFEVKCIDLNAKWHKLKFKEYYDSLKRSKTLEEYGEVLTKFKENSGGIYFKTHQLILDNKEPECLKEMIDLIIKENPTHVGLSFVYNSQVFWGTVIINKLKEHNIKCYVGGPATTDKLKKLANYSAHEVAFLERLYEDQDIKASTDMNQLNCNTIVDFTDYEKDDYLSKEIITPIKTSSSCPYKGCTFCTHHGNLPYFENSINNIIQTIDKSNLKNVFFIDDYILPKRLKKLSEALRGKNVNWWIQTKPVKEIIPILKEASLSGLKAVSWGVESGNQEILNKIKKGTNVEDIGKVLQEAKINKITNIVYIMFGFPTETKEQFIDTINLLKNNEKNIDMVSTTIFGLQEGSYIYSHPEEFSIIRINKEERTLLPAKITYEVSEGMSSEDATRLKHRYSKTLKKLNKLPQGFNIYKEQIILF
jgi:hypothetical protein